MQQLQKIAHAQRFTCKSALIGCGGGDFGEVPAEDKEANLSELEAGEGRILARYKQAYKLQGDIYINTYFSESNEGNLDYNNTMIMYCDEY